MKTTTTIWAALTASLMAGPALAHVTLAQGEAPAGSRYKAVLRLGHGCEGKATTALRVKLPDGFYDAKPMPKAGWKLQTVKGDYARPYEGHDGKETSGVREIIWSGGDLPDDWYDEFVLVGKIGPEVTPGSSLYFPTVQECGKTRQSWIDVTGADAAQFPAPSLSITAAAADSHEGHHGEHAMAHDAGHEMSHDMSPDMSHEMAHDMGDMTHAMDAAASPEDNQAAVQAGTLAVTGAFARATTPHAKVAGGYLTIVSQGDADRLLSASSPLADKVEIHEMTMNGDVMTMRPQPDGVAIPAGETVELKPGGYHLMLMGLKQPLVEGGTVPVTLNFDKAGKVDVTLQVRAINARGAAGGKHAQ